MRAKILRAVLRGTVRPALARAHDPARERARFDRWAARVFPPPRDVSLREITAGGMALRLDPPQAGAGMILYFHGGAYLTGSPRTHAWMVGALARRAGVAAVLPRYRLAPEHPAPAAFDDALAAWQALRGQGVAAGQMVLGGDSAGGGLALALLGHLCRAGAPPAGAFAFSPWTDLTLSGASLHGNARCDHYLPAERMTEARAMVLQGLDPADPRVSPLFADFPDPPPVLVHVAATEILRDDALRLADVLPGAEIRVAGDLPHVWPFFHAVLPEGRATLDATAGFIRGCLAPSLTDS
nr:alpha/beta hydrolase fold domain-containing protein [Pararhodobacter sp. SW119]